MIFKRAIYIFITGSLLLLPLTAGAYEPQGYVYGFSDGTHYCKDVKSDIDGSQLSETKKEVYQSLFDAQCLKETNQEDYYYAPKIRSKFTSTELSCENLQQEIVGNIIKEKDPSQAFIDAYKNECLSDTQSSSSGDGNSKEINSVIVLSAPIPVEGGEVIEASNKGYLFVYMIKMYRFVISIAGIIAVIELIFAGFTIGMAAGDTGKVENGKKRLIQTLEGLGILFTSAIILNTLNPVGYNFDTEVKILSVEEIATMNTIDYTAELIDNDPTYAAGAVTAQLQDTSFNSWLKEKGYDLEAIKKKLKVDELSHIYENDEIMQYAECSYDNDPNKGSCSINASAIKGLEKIAKFYYENSKPQQKMKINSAYRSVEYQAWLRWCHDTKNSACGSQTSLAAVPGTSRHNKGDALDVSPKSGIAKDWKKSFPQDIKEENITDDLHNLLVMRKAFYTQGNMSKTRESDKSSPWQRLCIGSGDERWHFDYNSASSIRNGCNGYTISGNYETDSEGNKKLKMYYDIPPGIQTYYDKIGESGS